MGMNRELHERRRMFVLPTALIGPLFQQGRTLRVLRGLPHDAVILGVTGDFLRDAVMVVAAHPSFTPVSPGCEPPVETIALEDITDGS
jgi:hypothetical protein